MPDSLDPFTFLQAVEDFTSTPERRVSLATVAALHPEGCTVTFDGEDDPTQKRYRYLTAEPEVGDRVAMIRVGGSHLILGTIYATGGVSGGGWTEGTALEATTGLFSGQVTLNSESYSDHLRLERGGLNGQLTLNLGGSLDIRYGGTTRLRVDSSGVSTDFGGAVQREGNVIPGEVLADVELTSAGEIILDNIPSGYRFLRVLFSGGDTSSDSIGTNNLGMRWNNVSTTSYRWNFNDFGQAIGTVEGSANYIPCGRLSQGTNRTISDIFINNVASWPTAVIHTFGNWGATGSRLCLTGATVSSTLTPLTRVTLYCHQSPDLAAGSTATLIGYR